MKGERKKQYSKDTESFDQPKIAQSWINIYDFEKKNLQQK